MKKISLAIMISIAAVSTALIGAYLIKTGSDPWQTAAKRESVELLAACLTESVVFGMISEYIFR